MCKWCYPDDDQDSGSSIIPIFLLIITIALIYGCVKAATHVVNEGNVRRDKMVQRELCMTEYLVKKDYNYYKANQICSTKYGLNPENYYGKDHDN